MSESKALRALEKENAKLKERVKELEKNAKNDLKEIKRLRTLASQLCKERNQALKED